MKSERISASSIDAIILLLGLIAVLLGGYFKSSLTKDSLQAIGTALIAAGLSSYLIRRFHSRDVGLRDSIEIMSGNRIDLEDEYVRRKYSAKELDIVSIALTGALHEMATDPTDRILKRVLFDRVKIRLMFLSPTAHYVNQRAVEDGVAVEDLQADLKQSVTYCIAIYNRLCALFTEATNSQTFRRERMGALEVRLLDMCPHHTVYHNDDEILWGIYTSTQRGYFSSVLSVKANHKVLYDQLMGHFDSMWDKGRSRDQYLVRFYGPVAPQINRKIMSQMLGPQWESRSPAKP